MTYFNWRCHYEENHFIIADCTMGLGDRAYVGGCDGLPKSWGKVVEQSKKKG